MKTLSESGCFGGVQGVYSHRSDATGTEMTFGLFVPAEAEDGPVPLLWYLSGLTCTHENAMVKAGAPAWAAEHGIAAYLAKPVAPEALVEAVRSCLDEASREPVADPLTGAPVRSP